MSREEPPTALTAPPPPGDPPPPTDDGDGSARRRGPRATGLADNATRGFAFMAMQTVFVRGVRFLGIFVLTYLVLPHDFKLYGLVLTVSQFVAVLRNAGVRDILIRRQHRVRKWVNPAVWMSATIGWTLAAVMALAAPSIAAFYGEPRLTPLIYVMAGMSVFQSLSQAPVGLLQSRMRFKLLATIESAYNSGLMILTVVFASLGFGAMSFVLPFLVCAVVRVSTLWWFARPSVRFNPQIGRWKYLIGDSFRLMSADVARVITLQSDMIILGRLLPGVATVGHYVFGNSVSRQSMMLFSRNLDLVLFPTLSKIQDDPARQEAAFVRALRMLTTLGVPLCFLQAAVADPIVHGFVDENFHEAVKYIAVLSIGMAGRLMISPAESMLRGQGRFTTFTVLNWTFAALFTVGAIVGALVLGGPFGVAVMIAATSGVGGVVYVIVALWRGPAPFLGALRVFAVPVLTAGSSCGFGWWVSTLVPLGGPVGGVVRTGVIVAVTAALYVPAVWVLQRDVCAEAASRIRGLLGKRLSGKLSGKLGRFGPNRSG